MEGLLLLIHYYFRQFAIKLILYHRGAKSFRKCDKIMNYRKIQNSFIKAQCLLVNFGHFGKISSWQTLD